MKNADIGAWVQEASAAEIAAFMSLAGARLVTLVGLPGAKAGPARLVKIEEAAQATGMSPRWFYDHAKAPFVRRLGRAFRVDLAALEAWQERGGAA
jgi:predicted DNA-binding transcriptional regulator AlpA